MIISPIIPIWIMIIICIILLIFRSKNKKTFIRQIIIIILIFIINLRIMFHSSDVQVMSNNLNVLFVIDNTISMVAEDYDGNNRRLEAVQKDCEYIIEKLSGANFSIITYKNDAQTLIPFTKDTNLAVQSIKSMQVMGNFYAKGTSINIAKDEMIKTLKKSNEKENKKTILFFITDGENTNGSQMTSFSEAKQYVDNGAVLGYGTQQGGYMKVKDGYEGPEKYIEDKTSTQYPYPKAVSKIDEENLKKISTDIGIDYIHMEKQSNINNKIKEIQKLIENTEGETKKAYSDIYYIFVIPLIPMLIYEFINYKRRL